MADHVLSIRRYWDDAASVFDEEPDHGLRAEHTRAAWAELLRSRLPAGRADVLDVGCGTGSLALLIAAAGHRVTGVDLAPRMVRAARAKLTAAGCAGRFLVGDAMAPPTDAQRFDVVLARHVVWTLADPRAALVEWLTRLRPGGRLVLVEGRWREAGQSGEPYAAWAESLPWNGGVGAEELAAVLRPLVAEVRVESLEGDSRLWGDRPVTDERYCLVAQT